MVPQTEWTTAVGHARLSARQSTGRGMVGRINVTVIYRLRPVASEQTQADQLRDLDERLDILEALVRVIEEPHRFVDIVLEGEDTPEAIEALRAAYGFNEVQAVFALDMQFSRLTRALKSRMRSDLNELRLERGRLTQS